LDNQANSDNFAFDDVLFLGRDFTEYQRMFNLNPSQLKGKRVLDCASGPSSFAAEANLYDINVTSCDPMYASEGRELSALWRTDVDRIAGRKSIVGHLFDDNALSEQFQQRKKQSRDFFLSDYVANASAGRYVHAELPSLPFDDKSFELALCANFLFLYTSLETGGMLFEDRFNYDFHKRAIRELIRVTTGEVKIYPIKGPHHDHIHKYIGLLLEDREFNDVEFLIEPVTYRDIKDAHEMLKIRCYFNKPNYLSVCPRRIMRTRKYSLNGLSSVIRKFSLPLFKSDLGSTSRAKMSVR
jgi:hypothetical protein